MREVCRSCAGAVQEATQRKLGGVGWRVLYKGPMVSRSRGPGCLSYMSSNSIPVRFLWAATRAAPPRPTACLRARPLGFFGTHALTPMLGSAGAGAACTDAVRTQGRMARSQPRANHATVAASLRAAQHPLHLLHRVTAEVAPEMAPARCIEGRSPRRGAGNFCPAGSDKLFRLMARTSLLPLRSPPRPPPPPPPSLPSLPPSTPLSTPSLLITASSRRSLCIRVGLRIFSAPADPAEPNDPMPDPSWA
jgi:hypothetical protein